MFRVCERLSMVCCLVSLRRLRSVAPSIILLLGVAVHVDLVVGRPWFERLGGNPLWLGSEMLRSCIHELTYLRSPLVVEWNVQSLFYYCPQVRLYY